MQEMICGYRVHPAASLFPLIDGDEFDSLVESIGNNGIQHPIVVRRSHDGDELIDGRNRLRAAQVARERGYVVDVPVMDWKDDGRNIAEWIWDTNALRRHLTEDAWVLASASITQMIRAENDERQKAAQFTKGTSGNPSGKKQVTTKTQEPAVRDRKAENARSTVGQVAAKAGVSMHKARQAIAVLDAVEAGTITPEAVAEVKAGKKKLRSVMPKKTKASAKKRRTMSALLVAIRDLVAEWKDADHNFEVLKDELKTQLERL
jgi:ParB-like chromosome segregation protein Spo0J